MAPIRKGDGTAVFPNGIQEVRTGDGRILSTGGAIPDSAVYYSKFAEGSGSTTVDEVSGTDGTINGADWVTGSGGEGDAHLDFVSANSDTVDTNIVPVTGSQNRTVACWINPDDVSSIETIISWGDATDGEKYTFGYSSGDLYLEVRNGGYKSSLSLSSDSWQFVGLVLDGSTVGDHMFYLDGTTESASGTSSVSTGSNNTAVIGYDTVASRRYVDAQIDAPWVANRAYSTSELDSWRSESKSLYGL